MVTSRGGIPQISIVNKDYNFKLTANQYVNPYTYYGNFEIPKTDIEKYGYVMSVTGVTTAGASAPVSLYNNGTSNCYVVGLGTSADFTIHVTFIKIT